MPRGDRTRVMASEVPLMYGIVAAVVTLGSVNEKLDHAKIGSGGCKIKPTRPHNPNTNPPQQQLTNRLMTHCTQNSWNELLHPSIRMEK